MRLNPMDILAKDTIITIGNKQGKVLSHEIHNATPCGKIVVHTVLITHKWKVLPANRGTWIEIDKPYKWTGNYTAITY